MSINNLFQKFLTKVYNNFHTDTAKMLIYTSIAGYALSSLAQIAAIAFSSKFSNEQKSFLLPQEAGDALANIGTFLAITTVTKKAVSKLYSTGKWGPKGVKTFLKSKPELEKNIGKLDFVVSEHLTDKKLLADYNAAKSLGTTVATIGAGILSSSIITPLIRNKMASRSQKKFMSYANDTEQINKTSLQKEPIFKSNYPYIKNYSSDLKI